MAQDFFIDLGIKTADLVAGLSGGIVNAVIFKRTAPMAIISSMLVGSLTANYLGEYAAKYTGVGNGAAAFIVGMAAMAICQSIVAAASKWTPSVAKNGDSPP